MFTLLDPTIKNTSNMNKTKWTVDKYVLYLTESSSAYYNRDFKTSPNTRAS